MVYSALSLQIIGSILFIWIGFTTVILFIGVFQVLFTTCILFLCWFCGINGLYIPLCANCWKNVETVENFWCVELRKNTIIKYQHNTNIIALVRSFTFCRMLYLYCITCNSTLNMYLFFYYKMQVIFKDFRQYFSSIRGGMFTLKKLINWRAMPIVVPLYS